jgi:SAM-dependent methyltransferase
VAKGHDGSSRSSGSGTPGPKDIKEAGKTTVGSRVRSQVPRERSGPIGISAGDFSTPIVRRRTTTQPRGLPVTGPVTTLEQPVTAPTPPPAPAPTPPPAPEITNVGAVPTDIVEAPRPAIIETLAQAATDEGPFTAPAARIDGANEASALAAEAAAVRALDSGPLTPPPDLNPDSAGSTVPVELGLTPAPEIAEPTPLPDAAATDLETAKTPPPLAGEQEVAVSATGALPVEAMSSGGSGASPESVTLQPLPDVAMQEAPAEEDADDHLEVVDGSEAGGDVDVGASSSASSSRAPSPPPIPGSYLKTPGPELIAPLVAPEVDEGTAPLLPPGLPILPEALAQRPRRPKRSKPWFEEVFDEDYLRTLPFMRPDQTLREVEFITETLRLTPGQEVLDVACGYGRHAIELVQRGISVTGLDLSLPLLIRAADEAQRRALSVNFVHADMREMAFERQFDGAYSMLTSFGYFDEETNLRVAERIARALKPGARFLLDIVNRDYVVADLPVRVWWEGTGCVVLEEVDFNFHTSRILTHRSIVFEDGRQIEQEISVRAYSLHEIGRLLRQAGFRVIDVSGGLAMRGQFFGSSSRSLLVVAEKREEDVA